MSNITTIHRDPENRAKDASNSIVLKANIFLFENSFSMLQANIFLIESSLSNVTTIHRENPKIRAHDALTTMLRPPLVNIDTGGHTKAPISLNIAPDFYQDPICRVTKG